ncbi:MAG: transposase [Nitrospirae bacterium]|nr:transposase [Nitrospirota bacterium]
MPRIVRGLGDNIVYHVINRGNGKQKVFHTEKDYGAFMELVKEAKERHSVKLYGYCLMPNHFHMAVEPDKGENLSRWMQWLMTSHVRRYHRYYNSSGHVWQGRYKSFMIQEDSHLLMVLRYIEGNPVRAKIVQGAREWQWSSHGETSGMKERLLTDEVPIELPEKWTLYVDKPFEESELDCLHKSVNRQTPFGDSTWQVKICKKFGLESTLRRRGRPKKEMRG